MKKRFLTAYDDYAQNILRHIYFRVGNKELAEDLTQETFFKTWRYISEKDKEIANLKTFLYKVANNLIIDHYRQKNKITVAIDDISEEFIATEAQQEKEIEKSFDKELIEASLLRLKDDQKQILVYRYIDDLSIPEISKLTGKTKENIRVIIHRGLKSLRETIKYD
ncbi:MAG: RNA polymerase sigma factor [Parcubacteria group bacterium]|nr:RNA polymerase sigma factor [Parcubacteria group bacterium]MCR4342338.1 RNA polymerase sigma factor [Patescibacteria group bacterium]